MQAEPLDLGAREVRAAASSVSGTQTSVARSFVPGKRRRPRGPASWRAFQSRPERRGRARGRSRARLPPRRSPARARGRRSTASLPAASTKRHGPRVRGARVGVDRLRRSRRPSARCASRRTRRRRSRRRSAGASTSAKRDPQRDGMLRDRVQPQRHLGDHGQRPLRADEEPGEVVAGGRLARRGCRCGSTRPVGEDGLEREQVGAHLPVAHRRRAGRVRRRHAAERRVGAGVDREEEPVLARGARRA